MTKKFSQTRRNAFLTALAQTGNQTLAAEAARVSRSWVQLHRSTDPEFDRACRDAIAQAKQSFDTSTGSALRTDGEGGSKPPPKWTYRDGHELVVRNSGGAQPTSGQARERGRPQIVRARLDGWSPRTEARFIAALTATCNVKAACAEVGLTPASAYVHRRKWPEFDRRWRDALRYGYDQIECALIEAGCNHLSGGGDDTPLPVQGMTFDNALRVLHMHKHQVRGLGKRPGLWARETDIEEVRAEVLHKLAVLQRAGAGRGGRD